MSVVDSKPAPRCASSSGPGTGGVISDQHESSAAEAEVDADASVLELLVAAPALWSIDELARELGDRVAAVDAADRLHAAGLAHRLDGFVFASRAAVRAARLAR